VNLARHWGNEEAGFLSSCRLTAAVPVPAAPTWDKWHPSSLGKGMLSVFLRATDQVLKMFCEAVETRHESL
jgi:hypothetical protein